MNKINQNKEKHLENTLKIEKGKTSLTITSHKEIENIVFPQEEFSCSIYLEPKSSLFIHGKIVIENIKGSITFISKENTTLSCKLGIKAKKENDLSICNIVTNNHNHSEIQIRVIGEEKSHTIIKTTGDLKKNTLDNTFLEEVKYLNEKTSCICCIPNLLVESNDVKAMHNVTIGCIREDVLFYLESKGIKRSVAKKLIRECFLKF